MIAKVILGTMTNARKLVSIAERISCDVELCSGRYNGPYSVDMKLR